MVSEEFAQRRAQRAAEVDLPPAWFDDGGGYRARRGVFSEESEFAPHLHVAARRALITERSARPTRVPPALTAEQLRNLDRARRAAPMRALLDWFDFDGRARRALVNPDQALAAELVRLTQLDPRWGFQQSVTRHGDRAELSHWVVGPGGVFLLNAKHHPGSRLYVAGDNFLVDGKDAPYVPQIRDQAELGADELSQSTRWDINVHGIIVPVADRQLTVDAKPHEVEVMEEGSVTEWLLNRPAELASRQILDAFQAVANRWTPQV